MQSTSSHLSLRRTPSICATALAIATIVLLPVAVSAQSPTDVIKQRQEAMKAIGGVMRPTALSLRGEAPYDAATIRQAASTLATNSGEAYTRLFPAGSVAEGSRAKPEIWTQFDAFRRYAGNLQIIATAMADASASGPGDGSTPANAPSPTAAPLSADALRGLSTRQLFAMAGETCNACHTAFRAERR